MTRQLRQRIAGWLAVYLRPAPTADEALELAKLILATLEQRRNQLAGRATVLSAASAALVVAYIQAVFGKNHEILSIVLLGIPGMIAALYALIESLKIVAGVGRSRSSNGHVRMRSHLLFYQSLVGLDAKALSLRLNRMNRGDILEELSAQSISLSRNLVRRYKAIERAYRSTVFSSCNLVAVVLLIRYDRQVYGMARLMIHAIEDVLR